MRYSNIELEQLYHQAYGDWPSDDQIRAYGDKLEQESTPPNGDPVPLDKRTSFATAIEQAFWDNGGPDLLARLAQRDPTEFLKLCAKLIPSDTKANGGEPLVNITVTTLPPQKIEKPIN